MLWKEEVDGDWEPDWEDRQQKKYFLVYIYALSVDLDYTYNRNL